MERSGRGFTNRVEQFGDGRIFHYDQLTTANMNIQQNTIDVNAGQDLFPVATLPGTSTCELTCTLGNFDTSLFELSEAVNFAANAEYKEYFTEKLTVSGNKVTLARQASQTTEGTTTLWDVSIAGMKQVTSTPSAEDEYQCSDSTGTTPKTTITFYTGALTGDVEVNYQSINSAVKEIVVDNKSSAIGTAVAKYPVKYAA